VCVVVLKIALPGPGWRLGADGRADVGVADGTRLPHSGRRSAGCGTSRVKPYQLRIVDPPLAIPPCNPADQALGISTCDELGGVRSTVKYRDHTTRGCADKCGQPRNRLDGPDVDGRPHLRGLTPPVFPSGGNLDREITAVPGSPSLTRRNGRLSASSGRFSRSFPSVVRPLWASLMTGVGSGLLGGLATILGQYLITRTNKKISRDEQSSAMHQLWYRRNCLKVLCSQPLAEAANRFAWRMHHAIWRGLSPEHPDVYSFMKADRDGFIAAAMDELYSHDIYESAANL
jgi:hypothetical protein